MPETAAGTPQRVLIVDNSRSIRTLLKIYLKDRNFEYFEAESGEEALKEVAQRTIDLVLVDFRMGGMSGTEFAMQVHSNPNGRNSCTPILLMTDGSNEAEVRAQGQKAGIRAFLRKPISALQLTTLVDTVLPPIR